MSNTSPLPVLLRGSILVPLLVAIDQASKLWVEWTLPFQAGVEIIPFLSLYRTYNEGIAFSFLSDLNDWVLVAITVAIIGFVLWLWNQSEINNWLSQIGFAAITGGAIGNLIDRAWLGHVVDFILFHTETWSFAVFNLADTFINIGAGFIILNEVLTLWQNKKENTKQKAPNNE